MAKRSPFVATVLTLLTITVVGLMAKGQQAPPAPAKPQSYEEELKALAEATQRNEPIVIPRSAPPPQTRGGASGTLDHTPNQQINYNEFAGDLRLTFQYLELYWSQTLPQVFGRQFTRTGPYHQYGATGAPHAAVCAGRALAPNNAFYCPDTDSIHWHGPFVVGLYQTYGDFAAAFVWAHEYSHAMQRRLGLLTAGRFSIQRELEADCLAGAWASWADKTAKILEPGDIDEALRVMFDARDRVGTPWFDPNAHGTAQARIRSFNLGYDRNTPKACIGQ